MSQQFVYLYAYSTMSLAEVERDSYADTSYMELLEMSASPQVAAISMDFSETVLEKVVDMALADLNDELDLDEGDAVNPIHRGLFHKELTSEAWSEEVNSAIAQMWMYGYHEQNAMGHSAVPTFMIVVQKRYVSA